jgi:hypothetical protein
MFPVENRPMLSAAPAAPTLFYAPVGHYKWCSLHVTSSLSRGTSTPTCSRLDSCGTSSTSPRLPFEGNPSIHTSPVCKPCAAFCAFEAGAADPLPRAHPRARDQRMLVQNGSCGACCLHFRAWSACVGLVQVTYVLLVCLA